jgi:HlyD family secretion protein
MKPELFIRAQNLFKVAHARSAKAIQDALEAPDAAGKRRKVAIMIGGGIFLFAAVIFIITHFITAPRATGEQVEQIQSVTAVRVAEHAFNSKISLTGEARPKRDIHVFSPTSGVRVLQLLADEGDFVRVGQPLARLDVALSTAQIRAAEASVAEARADALRARGEYTRAESIRDSGALSTEAIEQRQAAAVAAEARLAASQAALAETNARLQGGYVRAPVAGLVISRSVQLGAMVDQQEMFRIAGDNALEVAADVAESDVLALQRGQNASFYLADGGVVTARLSRLPASVDERSRTGQALFDLPRGTRVRAGMHLRGEVALDTHTAMAVPQSSILYDSGQAYVFIIGDDDVVRRADVTLGLRENDMVEIVNGLDQGARVAGSGAAFLKDGDKIRPINPTAPEGPSPSPRGADLGLRGRQG